MGGGGDKKFLHDFKKGIICNKNSRQFYANKLQGQRFSWKFKEKGWVRKN